MCGVVGLKPTYGRVSRYGLVAFASSLDQIGPLAGTVADAAILLSAIAGHDPRDSTSVDLPVPDYLARPRPATCVACGSVCRVSTSCKASSLRSSAAVRAAIDLLAGLGAEIVEVSLPHTEYALPVYYLIAPAEASANLARYDGIRYGLSLRRRWPVGRSIAQTRGQGFGPEVKRRIMLGTYALSAGYYDAYYLKAQQVRTLIKPRFRAGLAAVRRAGHADIADDRLQDRREGRRSAPDVPGRRLHPGPDPGRPVRHIAAVRL